jgi:peptidoglycan hydrolase-like protein with peptidoglycan-binding domain
VPYLLCYSGGDECKAGDLAINLQGEAVFELPDFGRQYASITLMPFAAGKTGGFDADNYAFSSLSYTLKISVAPRGSISSQTLNTVAGSEDARIQTLLAQIETLKDEIAKVKALLAARAAVKNYSCGAINADLFFGVENYAQVVCLQEFLKNQGSAIYPGGVISGRFLAETAAAVVRFQEKYAGQILAPLGLKSGTGYVGASTRAKINGLIK